MDLMRNHLYLNQMSLSHYKCTKKPNTYNIKRKNIFVITIQSITMYKFDNPDRPTQAQIFYNKSRFTKKNYQFYE